jgi:hypothetical protein
MKKYKMIPFIALPIFSQKRLTGFFVEVPQFKEVKNVRVSKRMVAK